MLQCNINSSGRRSFLPTIWCTRYRTQPKRETHLAAGEPGQEAQFDILLHPRLPELDRRKVETLEAVLDGPDRAEAMDVIRSLIDQVELRPRADGPGLVAVLQGDRTATLAACGEALSRNAKTPRRWGASGSFGRVGCGDAQPPKVESGLRRLGTVVRS
ncbi:hypothetical protein [Alsobacter sp. SYSU BS001988]